MRNNKLKKRYTMLADYNTIELKDKQSAMHQAKINRMLEILPDYCSQYENYCRNQVSLHTRFQYISDIQLFFRYLVINNPIFSSPKDVKLEDLEKINGFDFDAFLGWLSDYKYDMNDEHEKLKHNELSSKKRKMIAIKSFFHFLYKRDMIDHNPAEKAIIPKIKKKARSSIRVLEENEYALFLNAIENEYQTALDKIQKSDPNCLKRWDKMKPYMVLRDKAILYLFLGTGLRVSELCAINCSDISFELNYINVIRKGDSDSDNKNINDPNRVVFSDEIKEILLEYINIARDNLLPNEDNYDALFISSKRTRITSRGVEQIVKHYADKALGTKNGITPHKLRATFGTMYYMMTKDISATSTVMNHKSIEVTAKYYLREDKEAYEKVKNMKISDSNPAPKLKNDTSATSKKSSIAENMEMGKREVIRKLLTSMTVEQVSSLLDIDQDYIEDTKSTMR